MTIFDSTARFWLVVLALAASSGAVAADKPSASGAAAAASSGTHIERGRYLVKIAGCNDCHTSGYALSGGKVPEKEWLQGDELGWRGPWGQPIPPTCGFI